MLRALQLNKLVLFPPWLCALPKLPQLMVVMGQQLENCLCFCVTPRNNEISRNIIDWTFI